MIAEQRRIIKYQDMVENSFMTMDTTRPSEDTRLTSHSSSASANKNNPFYYTGDFKDGGEGEINETLISTTAPTNHQDSVSFTFDEKDKSTIEYRDSTDNINFLLKEDEL